MPKKLPGLTRARHAAVGAKLKEHRADLHRLLAEVAAAYGLTHRAARLCEKVLTALDSTRSELDERLANESTRAEWAAEKLGDVYYGGRERPAAAVRP